MCNVYGSYCCLSTFFSISESPSTNLFQSICISSWSVTIAGRPLFQIEVLAVLGRPVLIACERTLSGGEGLFALKFNGSPLLLVLQLHEQSISGQGPVSRDTLPI